MYFVRCRLSRHLIKIHDMHTSTVVSVYSYTYTDRGVYSDCQVLGRGGEPGRLVGRGPWERAAHTCTVSVRGKKKVVK